MTRTRGADQRASARRPLVRWLAVLVVALLVGGCDLRLETPAPPLPEADETEVVRQRTAEDAALLAELAEAAVIEADDATAGVLTEVMTVSQEHTAALGGLYEPFPDATPAPATTPTEEPLDPTPPATPAAVLTLLADTTDTARADAAVVGDARMARLVGSVAAARHLLAEMLARAIDGPAPTPLAAEPGEVVPEGVTLREVVALIQSEDAAGHALEVVAARSSGDDRARAAARASVHRDRAQAWAVAADVTSGSDPRRSTYALPEALTSPTTPPEAMWSEVAELEARLAASYASLVAAAAPGTRAPLIDAVADGARAQVAAGGALPAFPGLPERA